ncbi:MAG: DUF1778 domain-containing protein [Candidatus Omnitrophota bacterium]
MKTIDPKNTRIDLRVANSQKKLLMYAAVLGKMKLSTFVLNSARKEAERVLANKIYFFLPEKRWNAFCSALDRPAREIPRLKQLLLKPSVFDEK